MDKNLKVSFKDLGQEGNFPSMKDEISQQNLMMMGECSPRQGENPLLAIS